MGPGAGNRQIRSIGKSILLYRALPAIREFYVCPTTMTEMNQLYAYMLPHLKRLLDPEHRVLFLKDSKIINYLGGIEPAEIAGLEFGGYLGIEALSFATIEMRSHYPAGRPEEENSKPTTTSESTTPTTAPNETPSWQGRGVTLLCGKLNPPINRAIKRTSPARQALRRTLANSGSIVGQNRKAISSIPVLRLHLG